jgi:heptaprenyl diphosphate synthase
MPQTITLNITSQDKQIAKWTVLAIGLHMVEAAFPSPLPGVKPGVANIVVLYVLQRYGFASAVWVSLLRVFASSLLLGHFLSPTFFLSLAGALASLGMLGLAQWLPKRYFSVVSHSILAAIAHVLGQMCVVFFWLIPTVKVFVLLPPLLLMAIIFGLVNGVVVTGILGSTFSTVNNKQ